MKRITSDNPNKMHFESLHATFNRQTDYISTGNVWSRTQHSSYIRAYHDLVMPMGEPCVAGHLQSFDLDAFRRYGIASAILKEVRSILGEDGTGILYLFKHYNGEQRINDGLVLTDTTYHHLKTWYLNTGWKAQSAVIEARKYITLEYNDEHPY